MGIALTISDKTSSGEVLLAQVIQFPAQQVTVKELIETRVAQEVEAYNRTPKGEYSGLVQPTDSEVALNGFKLTKGRQLSIPAQQRTAIEAFKANGFFLLVNDRQFTELDEVITITPNTQVVFLKLVPLVGG